jgi:hypothetical protein
MMLALEVIFVLSYLTDKHHSVISFFLLALPPTMLAMGLGSQFGRPKNWWAAYLGTVMDVNLDRFEAEYGHKGHVLRKEIEVWFKDCGIKHYYQQNAFRYVFFHKRHATLFKLAWG